MEVEESWRRTRSKLLCISPTTCGQLDARARSKRNSQQLPVRSQLKSYGNAKEPASVGRYLARSGDKRGVAGLTVLLLPFEAMASCRCRQDKRKKRKEPPPPPRFLLASSPSSSSSSSPPRLEPSACSRLVLLSVASRTESARASSLRYGGGRSAKPQPRPHTAIATRLLQLLPVLSSDPRARGSGSRSRGGLLIGVATVPGGVVENELASTTKQRQRELHQGSAQPRRSLCRSASQGHRTGEE